MSRNQAEALGDWITDWLRTELKLADAVVARDVTFARFGMDSVNAMMLIGDLEEHLDRRLSPTLAWDHPTIDTLAAFLASGESANDASRTSAPDADDELARIDAMSEEEIDHLLEREQGGPR